MGTGDSLARLALGAGLLAILIRASSDVGALAWAVVVPGAGLWIAAWWEARARGNSRNPVLYASATALVLVAVYSTG
jgi:hypothetical protein